MNNFLKVLIAFLLIQFFFDQPLNGEEITPNSADTPSELKKGLRYLTIENITEFYVNRSIYTAYQTLNNPLIVDNHNVEVENLKKNLTSILNKYDEMKQTVPKVGEERQFNEALVNNIIHPVFNVVEYYFDLPKEQQTADTKLIVETLKKYDGAEMYRQIILRKAMARYLKNTFPDFISR